MNHAPTGIAAEAAEDAASELDRMATSDNFEDPLAGQDLGAMVTPPDQQSVDLRASLGAPPRTLEDLYAEHPEVGAGTKFLRVIRRQPTVYRGQRIVGVLEDLHEQLSMADFADRYGGGTYEVSVMGHVGGVLEGDNSPVRSLRTMRFDVAGFPRVMSYSANANSEVRVNTRQQYNESGVSPVELERFRADQKRIDRAETERQRAMDAMAKSAAMSPDMLSRIDSAAERRAQEVRVSLTETLTIERDRCKRQIAELEAKDATISKLNQELLDERSRATMRMREVDTEKERELRKTYDTQFAAMKSSYDAQITEMKRSHDEEMKRLTASSSDTLQRITEKATNEVTELSKRRDEERKAYIEAAEKERERLREDANQRNAQLVQDYTLRSGESHRQEEMRLKEQEKSYGREIEALKSAHAREIESIKLTTQSLVATSEATSRVQIQSLQSELSRAEARNVSLERDNEELRAKGHKSFKEQLAESQEIAGMTGWVPGGETQEAPKAFSWQESVAEVFKGAIQKVPDILRSIEEARLANQASRQGVPPQAMAPAGYQRQLPPGPPQSMPMQQQQQQQAQHARRAYRPGAAMAQSPPAWGQHVDPISNPILPQPGPPNMDAVAAVPRKFVNPVDSAGKPDEPKSVPVSGQEVGRPAGGFTPFEENRVEPQPVEEYQPPAQAPQAAPSPAPSQANVPFTGEQIDAAVKQLEMAVSTDMFKPEQAAAEFVKVLGPEAARAVVAGVHPDHLVDSVAQGRPQTPLATYEGREYVRNMWVEMAKLAG